MKNVLVITEHPAPYWSKTMNAINQDSNASVIYIKEKVASKPWKKQEYFEGVLYKFKNIPSIIKRIYEADQIVLGGIYLKQLRLLFVLSILMGKKVALFSDVPSTRKRSALLVFFKRKLYKMFNLILVSGYEGIDHYNLIYGIDYDKMLYFPYAWDEGDFVEIDFDKRPFNVFISNRFLERKGYDILLKALQILNEKGVLGDFYFTIAGEGPLMEKFVVLFSELENLNYEFKGWISYDEYVKELNSCQIYVHTSKFEPFGIPILDAMHRGKIVIASNKVMSASDFITNEFNGFTYDAFNHMELATIFYKISQNNYDLNFLSHNVKSKLKSYSTYIKDFTNKINL